MHARTLRNTAACVSATFIASSALGTDWTVFDLAAAPPKAGACNGTSVALFQPGLTLDTGSRASLWAGAPFADGARRASGIVTAWSFVTQPGMSWQYAWQLSGSDPQPGALFGASIAYGETLGTSGSVSNTGFLLVGSPGQRLAVNSTQPSAQAAGLVEVFPLTNALTAPASAVGIQLLPPVRAAGDQYGTTVAASIAGPNGGTLPWAFASAPGTDLAGVQDAGAVHAFRRDGSSTFTHAGMLTLPDAAPRDRLGRSAVAAQGDRIFASSDRGSGQVAVFAMASGSAPAFESLVPTPASNPAAHGFGASIACNGSLIAVGAPGAYGQPPEEGKVFILDAAPPHALRSVVDSPWPDECAGFGSAIAFRGSLLVVATEQGGSSAASGKVAVFTVLPASGTATLGATLSGTEGSAFGASVATTQGHTAIGAPATAEDLSGGVIARSYFQARSPDINGDGIVDGFDLGRLLGAWRPGINNGPEDLNYDSFVNGADLTILLAAWGTTG